MQSLIKRTTRFCVSLKVDLLMVMQVRKVWVIWHAVEQRRVRYYC